MRGVLMALGFVFCAAAWSGCGGPDKAKMEACAKDPAALADGDGCKKCCKEAGASGHSWIGLDEPKCTCM